MEKIKYIFLFLVAINILSCSNNNTQDKLEDISTYVCTNPDSARKELNKIKKSELTTKQLRANHALLLCESEYLTKCTVDDSTLNVASIYFLEGKNGTTSQQMEAELLYIYKEIYNKPAEALTKLLEIEKNIDDLSSPYFKAMTECFIMIIYYNHHEFNKMLKHAYLEYKYAKLTNEATRIINCKNHIGEAYKNMQILDSAYIIFSSIASDKNIYLDSQVAYSTLNNLSTIIKRIKPNSWLKVKETLITSKNYVSQIDKNRINMLLAECCYNLGNINEADSFKNLFYQNINDNEYELLNYFANTLNNYYEKTGDIDSANKYKGEMLKYRIMRDSAIRASRVMEITHQSEMEEIEEDSQTKIATISIISLVAIGALLWGIAVYRGKRNKLRQEYSDNVEKLHKIQEELEEAKEKERASRRAIASESQRHRFEVKRLTDMADTYSMKVLAMLTKNGCTDFKPTAAISEQFYTSINNVYSKTDKGKDFVKKITEACPSIKDRELFICLLYREGINNEKTISNILNVTDGTFRTIKSRLKKKLEEVPENCYINEILKSIGQ